MLTLFSGVRTAVEKWGVPGLLKLRKFTDS